MVGMLGAYHGVNAPLVLPERIGVSGAPRIAA
jgi:hypothetical protein